MKFFRYLKSIKNNSGFTLIEVLIAAAVFSVIILAISSIIISYNKTTDLMAVQLALQGEGRNALSQMVNDLRRTNGGSNGAYAIDSATDNSLIFYSNIDTDTYFEKVEYFISGNELRKSVTKPSGNPLVYNPASKTTIVLSRKIANNITPLFSYYDSTYEGSGSSLMLPVDVTAIRFIKVNLVLDNNPAAPVSPLNMEAKVAIRNLKDN